MIRKGCLIILCCLLIFSFFNVVSGKTIYVDDNGGKDYTRIQDAINSSNDGDTIFVYNGTYYEHIVIEKSISLIGENKNYTIIKGLGYDASFHDFGDAVYVNADWVNISGFTITNGSEMAGGVELYNSNFCVISDSIITKNYDGIKMDGSSNCTISGNVLSNSNDNGIFLYPHCNNNTIESNTISSNKNGITIWSKSNNNIILGNIITDSSEFGIDLAFNSDYNNISRNTIDNNQINGIDISSSNNTISNNNIVNNKLLGIQISDESQNNHISDNYFSNNGEDIYYGTNYFRIKEPSESKDKGIPGFELILVISAIALVFLLKRKRI